MRAWILLLLCGCAAAQSGGGHGGHGHSHGGPGGHTHGGHQARLAKIKAAIQTCQSDVDRVCSGSSANLRSKVRCLATHQQSLSTTCRTALLGALHSRGHWGRRRRSSAPTPAPGTTTGQQVINRSCLPSIMKKCKPQAIELMTNPLDTDGATLVQCAKGHSKTISPRCEAVVARLTQDGFAEKMVACGQTVLRLCPAETLAMMGAEMNPTDTDPQKMKIKAAIAARKIMAFVKCIHPKSQQLSATCRAVTDSLTSKGVINSKSKGKKTAPGVATAYNKHDEDDKDDDDDGASPAAGIVIGISVFAILVIAMAGAVLFWKRQRQQQHARQAGMDFQALGDEGERLQPPDYDQHSVPVATVVDSLPPGAKVHSGAPVV